MTRRRTAHGRARSRQGTVGAGGYPAFPQRTIAELNRINQRRPAQARSLDSHMVAKPAPTPEQWKHAKNRTDVKGIDLPTPTQIHENRGKMSKAVDEAKNAPTAPNFQTWAKHPAETDLKGIDKPKTKKKRGLPRRAVEKLRRPKSKRAYPEVKNVNTLEDARRLVKLIERDHIPKELKRQRLQFMYALSYAKDFEKQFKDNITEARDFFHSAYMKYTKKEIAIGEEKPKPSPKPGILKRIKQKVTAIKPKPKPKTNLAELYKAYEPPEWVKDKAKYRDTWRHYVSECRKAGVGDDRFDFDQELYDEQISRDAIKENIRKKVWGMMPDTRAIDEYLAQRYEEVVGIPRSEYEKLMMKAEQAEGATA